MNPPRRVPRPGAAPAAGSGGPPATAHPAAASGTWVVLPAPGGASSTRRGCDASCRGCAAAGRDRERRRDSRVKDTAAGHGIRRRSSGAFTAASVIALSRRDCGPGDGLLHSAAVNARDFARWNSSTSAPTWATNPSTTTSTRCSRARAPHGVARMVVTGASREGSHKALELARAHPGCLYATAGVHPHHATEYTDEADAELRALLAHDRGGGRGRVRPGLLPRLLAAPRAARAFERQLQIAVDLAATPASRCSCTSATRMPTSWR
jgi:hypothetical protein